MACSRLPIKDPRLFRKELDRWNSSTGDGVLASPLPLVTPGVRGESESSLTFCILVTENSGVISPSLLVNPLRMSPSNLSTILASPSSDWLDDGREGRLSKPENWERNVSRLFFLNV